MEPPRRVQYGKIQLFLYVTLCYHSIRLWRQLTIRFEFRVRVILKLDGGNVRNQCKAVTMNSNITKSPKIFKHHRIPLIYNYTSNITCIGYLFIIRMLCVKRLKRALSRSSGPGNICNATKFIFKVRLADFHQLSLVCIFVQPFGFQFPEGVVTRLHIISP